MLRGLWRGASLAILLGLSLSLVACSQFGKLQAKRSFKDANVQYQAKEYKRAAALYEQAIASDPALSVAYFYLANSYDNQWKVTKKGDAENDALMTKAIENYKKAADSGEDIKIRRLALEFLVAAYGPDKMNDSSQLEPIVQKMIQLDPQEPTGYFSLAKVYEDAGEYEKAEQTLLKAKEVRPNSPDVYVQLAAFYNRQEEFEKTIDALQQRATIEQNNPEAIYTIGAYYWEKAYRDFRLPEATKKDYVTKGLGAMDKALALKSDYMDALTMKNILLRMQANMEKDLVRQKALIAEADTLRDRAMELKKKQVAGIKQ
jgi:tetratricopeptide (TPR) repeat protein